MSGKYLAGRDALAAGAWLNRDVFAQLISGDYVFSEDHDISDLSGFVGDEIAVTGRRFLDGWAQCDELKFQQVSGGNVAAIVFHTDRILLEYHDAIEGFPLTTNGGDIEVEILQPGIFRL